MTASTPHETLQTLLPDGGRKLLERCGLASWEDAMADLPPNARQVEPGITGALRLLVRIRDARAQKQDLPAATALTEFLVQHHQAEHGADHPDVLVEMGALGALKDRAGREDEARSLLEQAWKGLSSRQGDLRLAVVAQNLGAHHLRRGELDRAEGLLRQAWHIRTQKVPEATGNVAAQLADALLRQGKLQDALPFLRESWDRYRKAFGDGDPRTQNRARALAHVLRMTDALDEAVDVLRAAWQGAPKGDVKTAIGHQLARTLEEAGHTEEAFRRMDEVIRATRALEEPHPELPERLGASAAMLLRRGHPQEAEDLLHEALEAARRIHGEQSAQVGARYVQLGDFCARRNRSSEALGWLEAGTSILERASGPADARTVSGVARYAEVLAERIDEALGRRDRTLARELLGRGWPVVTRVLERRHESRRKLDEVRLRVPGG